MSIPSSFSVASATFLFVLSTAAVKYSCLPLPPLALLSLKSSLCDPLSTLSDWSIPPNFNFSVRTAAQPPWCSWSGVSCTGEDVSSLDLSFRNLSGDPFPPELRLLSPFLSSLNLSTNSFSGPIPSSSPLFHLRSLRYLDLSRNDFNSSIPSGLFSLRRLSFLNLYSNSFSGAIPVILHELPLLEHLNLGGSFLSSAIPSAALIVLPGLRFLHLAGNLLAGPIPPELGRLSQLEHMEIGYNSYDGSLPPEIGRLRNLRYLDISSANLSGGIPPEIGNLTELESLFLFKNGLSGGIPIEISRLIGLKVLDLSDNCLSGRIPADVSFLTNLSILSLMNNELSGEIPPEIVKIASIEALLLWNNSLTGALPPMLGSGGLLERLDVSSNSLSGPIPPGLCKGKRLVRLILFSNRFESVIPPTLARCSSLWRIRIEDNRLNGPIPVGFGHLENLTFFDLSSNNFSGEIPLDLGTAPRLQFLNISGNPLRSNLPETIWMAPALQIFSLSNCQLRSEIPSFGSGCKNLYKLEMSGNYLRGNIPTDIARCQKLLTLKLDRNHLVGTIPPELAELPFITDVDLSLNLLVGAIPPAFDNCSTLESFNVSFNRLTGLVPASTVLGSLNPSSFAGNPRLCGLPVGRPCATGVPPASLPHRTAASAGPAVVWIATAAVIAGLVVLIAGTRWSRGRYDAGGRGHVKASPGQWQLTAFQRLSFTADDVAGAVEDSAQIIGIGSAGTVYRAEMPSGDVIAIKKLFARQKRAAAKKKKTDQGILQEVEVISTVRHRNIVRLLGYCSNGDLTMLLYEYMPMGNLDDLLHGSAGGGKGRAVLDWETRYRIAVGVAEGMSYLHHDCEPAILHRDLKPSNILLDGEMEARVADFGVAKALERRRVAKTMSAIAGSCGYIAPEYAYTLRVDERSDVYSYGVVLMEMVTGSRPVGGGDKADFGEGRSVVEWVREKVRTAGEGVGEVLDEAAGTWCREVRAEMVMVLRLALLCTSASPADRPSMRDVVSMLRAAKPRRKAVADTGGKVVVEMPAAVVSMSVEKV